MRSEDIFVINRMIKYCQDVDELMQRFHQDFATYKTDISFQYACNMCIIQIGELVYRLSEDIKESERDIPWNAIRAMRNLHAHDYERVDLEIVWNTLVDDIPELRKKLENLLD